MIFFWPYKINYLQNLCIEKFVNNIAGQKNKIAALWIYSNIKTLQCYYELMFHGKHLKCFYKTH